MTEVDKLVYNDEFSQIRIDLKQEYKQIMNEKNEMDRKKLKMVKIKYIFLLIYLLLYCLQNKN